MYLDQTTGCFMSPYIVSVIEYGPLLSLDVAA